METQVCGQNRIDAGGALSVVALDERFRLTLTRRIRKEFRVSRGQRLYVIPAGDTLIVKQIPRDPAAALAELIGDFRFNRRVRRKAEAWMLREARKSWE